MNKKLKFRGYFSEGEIWEHCDTGHFYYRNKYKAWTYLNFYREEFMFIVPSFQDELEQIRKEECCAKSP